MGSLPPSGVPVARVRRGPPSAIPLLATLLVVVLLLSAFSFVLLDLGAPRPDDVDDDEEQPSDGIMVIREDTTWQGVNRTLRNPVLIEDDSTLTMDGCDIAIELEDLLMWRMSAFEIDRGSELKLNSSRLHLVVNQNLSSALYHGRGASDLWGYPLIYRVVNLIGAGRPVLAFNTSLRGGHTDLLVFGQQRPGGPLGLLATVPTVPGIWERHEVDLSSLSGGVVRLAIAPLSGDYGGLYLTDARVLDGGSPLPGDVFDTGRPWADEWQFQGLETLAGRIRHGRPTSLPALIECDGALDIASSELEAPTGFARWRDVEAQDVPWQERDRMEDWTYHRALIGAHVQVDDGEVSIATSRLVNVPVRVDDGTISIRDSHLEADADVLTLRGCTGEVAGSELVRGPNGLLNEGDTDYMLFYLWAVSVEEVGAGPLALVDCSIEGGAVGLFLMRASPTVERCAFADSTAACVWSQDPTSSGGWSRLNATCTFRQDLGPGASEGDYMCPRLRYIEVGSCRATMTWLNVPSNMDHYYNIYSSSELESIVNDIPLEHQEDDVTTMLLPSIAVLANGTEARFGGIPFIVSIQWDELRRTEERTIEQGTKEVSLRFDLATVGRSDYLAKIESDGRLEYDIDPGEAPGELVMNVSMDLHTLQDEIDVDGLRVHVSIDGVEVRELDVLAEFAQRDSSSWAYHELGLEVGQGIHTIGLDLWGRLPGQPTAELLHNVSTAVMRANGTTPAETIEESAGRWSYLLLDPGADIVLDELPTFEEESVYELYGFHYLFSSLSALLSPGSKLTLKGDFTPEDSYLTMWIIVQGQGNFTLDGCGNGSLYIFTKGANLTVNGTQDTNMYLQLNGPSVRLLGSRVRGLDLYMDPGTDLVAEGCAFYTNYTATNALNLGSSDCTIAFRDCAFSSNVTARSVIDLLDACSLDIQDCTFDNVSLRVSTSYYRNDAPSDVTVDGCAFTGEQAFLVIAPFWYGILDANHTMLDIANVTFDGHGTGAILTGAHLAALRECTLLHGAAVLQTRPFAVVVLDEDEYQTGNFDIEVLGMVESPPFYEEDMADLIQFTLFEAVEGDSPYAYDGREVTFVLYQNWEIVWFEEGRLLGDGLVIEIPEWDDMVHLVLGELARYSPDTDWWTDVL